MPPLPHREYVQFYTFNCGNIRIQTNSGVWSLLVVDLFHNKKKNYYNVKKKIIFWKDAVNTLLPDFFNFNLEVEQNYFCFCLLFSIK